MRKIPFFITHIITCFFHWAFHEQPSKSLADKIVTMVPVLPVRELRDSWSQQGDPCCPCEAQLTGCSQGPTEVWLLLYRWESCGAETGSRSCSGEAQAPGQAGKEGLLVSRATLAEAAGTLSWGEGGPQTNQLVCPWGTALPHRCLGHAATDLPRRCLVQKRLVPLANSQTQAHTEHPPYARHHWGAPCPPPTVSVSPSYPSVG